jgi:4-hydroxy-2-oxoglutarate aldolase
MKRFEGVAPPVVTPFRDDEVASDWLKENLERLSTTGLSGYLVLGSNGEAVHLAPDEKSLVMDTAR